ncbi:scopoletin glucosyltransferase [Trifolium repens]|nr:scopoletin glucosyltransferase [Trifolium repens]
MITWPMGAEQFYNEKLVTDVLKIGVPVGVKKWIGVVGDSVQWSAVEKAVKRVMEGEDAEEMRNKAKLLAQMAKKAVEEGGSSSSQLNAFIEELSLVCNHQCISQE